MKLSRPSRVVLGVLALLLVSACEHKSAPATIDTLAAAKPTATDSTRAASPERNWDQSAGPVLVVAGETPVHALVVAPDSASAPTTMANLPHPASVVLFGRNGTVQTAELPAVSDSDACAVATLNAAPPPRPWNVGFIGGVVSPLPMDSIGSFSRADSLDAAANVTRLASAMPNDSAGRFTGLPFLVRSIWRFSIPGGPTVFAALLSRQINQEATPLQEHTLVIAERSPTDSTLNAVYSERSYGDEETIESRDVLAAVLIGTEHRTALVVSRDFGNATSYGLIERGDDGKWRARWVSARRHC